MKRFLALLHARIKAVRKCFAIIRRCGNTYTPTGPGSTSVLNVVKPSWKVPNSSGTNWFIPGKNRFSVRSRGAANASRSTSIYAPMSESIRVIGLTSAHSMAATRNLHSPQTSSPTSSHTPSKSKKNTFAVK